LKEQRYKVKGVNFGNKAKNPIMYGNMRAQMWGDMREWLKTASIPNDRFLKTDLISPMMKPDFKGTIFLESKKDMKARGLGLARRGRRHCCYICVSCGASGVH